VRKFIDNIVLPECGGVGLNVAVVHFCLRRAKKVRKRIEWVGLAVARLYFSSSSKLARSISLAHLLLQVPGEILFVHEVPQLVPLHLVGAGSRVHGLDNQRDSRDDETEGDGTDELREDRVKSLVARIARYLPVANRHHGGDGPVDAGAVLAHERVQPALFVIYSSLCYCVGCDF